MNRYQQARAARRRTLGFFAASLFLAGLLAGLLPSALLA